MKKYTEYKDLSLNEASVPPPHILHTLLVIQNGLKLAHWQTRSFPQHKALDDAHAAISISADKLAEAYMGKYGDHGRYLHYDMSIGLTNFKTQQDVETFVQVCLASINMCAMMCLKKEEDTELLNIIDEIRAELEKLKYLFTLKESINSIEESTNDPNSFEIMIQQVMKIASKDFFDDLMDQLLSYDVAIIKEYGKGEHDYKSLLNIKNYWVEFKYKGEKFKMQFSNSGYSVYCDPGVNSMSTSLSSMFKKIDKYLKDKDKK